MAASSDGIIVLGANGQLGSDIVGAARRRPVPCVPLGRAEVDVTNPEQVFSALRAREGSTVVNCAAFHQVDKCEDDPETAFRVNAIGALNVARACDTLGKRLIHLSTDYVFSGERAPPVDGSTDPAHAWTEKDAPSPCNTYGTSKLAGEQLVHQVLPSATVARVSSLFGIAGPSGKGRNFVETMIHRAKERLALQVVDDQWMTPTYTRDAAEAILDAASVERLPGVLHVTAPDATNWYRFAQVALKAAGLEADLSPIRAAEFPSPVKRPPNSALNTDLLAKTLGRRLPAWSDALGRYLEEKGHVAPRRS